MFTVTTRYRTTDKGQGRITATAQGKQATTVYDHEHSREWNHGNAAGELLRRMGFTSNIGVTHTAHDNARHTFEVDDSI